MHGSGSGVTSRHQAHGSPPTGSIPLRQGCSKVRRAGADNSVFRYYATGSTLIWRRTPLSSTSTTAFIRRAGDRSTGMLDAAKVRNGALRIRFLILDRNYGLITAF